MYFFYLWGGGDAVGYLVSAVVIIFKQFHDEFEHFRWTDGMNVSQQGHGIWYSL